jgi:adenosylhomocysteine nucleosidase
MLLIAAALREELNVALDLCEDPQKIRDGDVEFWRAGRNGRTIHFLKTGVGPRRSAACLKEALSVLEISHILVLGYAGALDPELKLGTLVVVRNALACRIDKCNPAVENMMLDRSFTLAPSDSLVQTSESLYLPVCSGDTLTSSHVWGNPEHKKVLLRKFRACIVDMETAALAGVSEKADIPLRCIRVVSDEAGDSFLEPFSYDPEAGIPKRAGRLIRKGNPVKAFRKWKRNASEARNFLSSFLAGYL